MTFPTGRYAPALPWLLLASLLAPGCSDSNDTGGDAADAALDVGASGDGAPVDGVGLDTSTACHSHGDCPQGPDLCALAVCTAAGTCAEVLVCACADDSDCEQFGDNDPCNGTLYCDKTGSKPGCRVNPATVITCKPAESACEANRCDPFDGKCKVVPIDEGKLCGVADPCIVNARCKAGSCSSGQDICACHGAADCAALDDADKCNGTLYCDDKQWPHVCAVSPSSVVHCKDETGPCQQRSCEPTTGTCVVKAVVGPGGSTVTCDDGDPCTLGDACVAGQCTSGAVDTCSCASNADCATLEDGDACNGTLYCDTDATPPTCALNPATVVHCPSVGDTTCLRNVCFPLTGICQPVAVEKTKVVCGDPKDKLTCASQLLTPGEPAPKPTACSDGEDCTTGEACSGGSCVGGTDTCACTKDADCVKQDDGDHCNGLMFCDKAKLQCQLNPQSIVFCPSVNDTECSKNTCLPLSGACTPTAIGKASKHCHDQGGETKCRWALKPAGTPLTVGIACDDGDVCTKGDVCQGDTCAVGPTYACACKSNADCVQFDDGDLCNGVHYCDLATHKCQPNPSSKVNCPTVNNTDCLVDTCQPKTGLCKMTVQPDGKSCSDGNVCTAGDFCLDGLCKSGPSTCECESHADCASKEDGNLCNGTLYCDKSGDKPACKLNPASVVSCNKQTGSPCLKSLCNPETAKCAPGPAPDGGPCNDGTLCTHKDACVAGVCVGKAVNCDDDNACTNDTCSPSKGCSHVAKVCQDDEPCTQDGCNPDTGKCVFDPAAFNGKLCNADDNGCTLNDACAWGKCKMGIPLVCKLPTKTCEQAICLPLSSKTYKCILNQAPDGTPCDDGLPCTVGAGCKSGKCSGAGHDRFFVKSYAGPAGAGYLHGVGAFSDGSMVAAGQTWTKSGTGHAIWLLGLDGGGAVKWSKQVKSAKADSDNMGADVLPQPDGSAWIAGTSASSGGDDDAIVLRVDADGTTQLSKTFGDKSASERVAGLTPGKSGNLLIFGSHSKGGTLSAWAHHVASNLQPNWPKPLLSTAGGHHQFFYDAAWLPDGDIVFVGERRVQSSSAMSKPLWLRVSASGAPSAPVIPSSGGILRSVAVTAGRIVAGGTRKCGGAWCRWLVGMNSAGTPLWTAKDIHNAGLARVLAVAKDRFIVAGDQTPPGKKSGVRLQGVDRYGNQQWSRAFDASAARQVHGIAGMGNDGVALAGTEGSGNSRKGLVVRTDPWGHASCAAAGGCMGKKPEHCDDGKPCTVDWCDAKSGCKHSTVDNLTCDPGDGCSPMSGCQSGSCKTVANGRLFRYDENQLGKTIYGGAARMTDGTFLMTGQTTIGGKRHAFIRRLSASGAPICKATFQASSGVNTFGVDVSPRPSGQAEVLARAKVPAGGGNHRYGTRASVDSGCKILKLDTGSYFKTQRPHRYLNYADGSQGIIFETSPHNGNAKERYLWVSRWWPNKIVWDSQHLSAGAKGLAYPFGMVGDGGADGTIWGPGGAVAANGDSLLFASTKSSIQGHWLGWVGRLNASGKTMFRVWTNVDDVTQLIEGGAGLPQSRTLAVGRICHSGDFANCKVLIVVLNSGGQQIFSSAPFSGFAHSAVGLPGGAFLFASTYFKNGKYTTAMVRWSAQPYTGLWSRIWWDTHGMAKTVESIAGSDDLLIGIDQGWGKKAILTRTDRWFHRGCGAAGSCLTKNEKSCSDGNSCTLDYCQAGQGCKHIKDPGACP